MQILYVQHQAHLRSKGSAPQRADLDHWTSFQEEIRGEGLSRPRCTPQGKGVRLILLMCTVSGLWQTDA